MCDRRNARALYLRCSWSRSVVRFGFERTDVCGVTIALNRSFEVLKCDLRVLYRSALTRTVVFWFSCAYECDFTMRMMRSRCMVHGNIYPAGCALSNKRDAPPTRVKILFLISSVTLFFLFFNDCYASGIVFARAIVQIVLDSDASGSVQGDGDGARGDNESRTRTRGTRLDNNRTTAHVQILYFIFIFFFLSSAR